MKKYSLPHTTKAQLAEELAELRRRLVDLEAAEAERRQAAEVLRESEAKYRALLDESSDPIFAFYPDGQYRYVNQAFADGVGKKVADIVGKKIWDVFPQDEADRRFAAVRWVFEHGETRVIEVRVPRPDGDRYYITTVKPVQDAAGRVISVMCISKEITDRKRMEQELQRLSTHDVLTGVYNRNFFEVELARMQPGRLFPVSVVVTDMDNLKIVNDGRGHAAGDELLRRVAEVLRQSFRVEDIIARIGGDEFAVLLPQTDEAAAQAAVARLRANLEQPGETPLYLSIGLASGGEGSSLIEVMRLADDRMYEEKAAHRREH